MLDEYLPSGDMLELSHIRFRGEIPVHHLLLLIEVCAKLSLFPTFYFPLHSIEDFTPMQSKKENKEMQRLDYVPRQITITFETR